MRKPVLLLKFMGILAVLMCLLGLVGCLQIPGLPFYVKAPDYIIGMLVIGFGLSFVKEIK